MSETAEQRYRRGMDMLPAWDEEGPEADARYAEGVALVIEAADAGHEPAMRSLADGVAGEEAGLWCVRLAQAGEDNPLKSSLTNTDFPPEHGLAVLEAARRGEPWAMAAVGGVYRMGMADARGLMATRDGAWGWLPGVEDPAAEGLRWVTLAAEAGWATASMSLGYACRRADPAACLAHLRAALREGGKLTARLRDHAERAFVEVLDEVGAPWDERLAARRRLAELGDGDAMCWLGDRHRSGDGLALDPASARSWYERAAAAGSVEARRELGRMCEEGIGGAVDEDRARALYEQAAELGGDVYARRRLVERFGLSWYGGPDLT